MLDWFEYERWMSQALKTYELIDADIEHEGYSWACFKAHQAAEYAIKALLYLAGKPGFGHDLLALARAASTVCGEPDASTRRCIVMLDKMYIPPRYPDAFPGGAPWEHYTLEEALEAKECARLVIDWVRRCARDLGHRVGEEED